ncbi:MAG: TetR/AcrR family transcriptional regulator [Acidobacteriota bacterium]
MRYGPDHKEQTRRRIIDAAAELFREKGPEATALPEVMAAAGLTVGGFYRHFESKDELFLAALERAMGQTLDLLRGKDKESPAQARGAGTGKDSWIARAAAVYLHPAHRANVAGGCPLPVLSSEVARRGGPARRRFEDTLVDIVDEVEPRMPSGTDLPPRERSWGFLATLVGGLLLARGVDDDGLADEILTACRHAVAPEARTGDRGAPDHEEDAS